MEMEKISWMSDEEYKLVTEKSVIPTNDLVVLRGGERWEVALFVRKTGYEVGKWCVIGGRQWKGEVAEEAIKRQASEMGVAVAVILPFEPNFPAWVHDDPKQDRTKHSLGSVYPVVIVDGQLMAEGSEYSEFHWFTIDNLPSDNHWAYHHKFEVEKTIEQLKRFGVTHIPANSWL